MNLIYQLKQFDNEEGYKLSYDTVKPNMQPIISKLVEKGEEHLDELHSLLIREETWSSLFALQALKGIKSEKSTPFLIEFIKKNDDSDYFESCEDAMWALQAIGKPAVKPLLNEMKKLFEKKEYVMFLVGALTGIKDDEVYSFMLSIVEDYMRNLDGYKGWFMIDDFTYHFDEQGKKEILPLLQKIHGMNHLSERESIELRDTIKKIEDPEGFEQEIKSISQDLVKLGRNEPCHCGSGKKYKKCCLDKDIKETGKPKKVPLYFG